MSTDEPSPATLVGGPFCVKKIPRNVSKRWHFYAPDELRDKLHQYDRRSPNDPNFYFKASLPGALRPSRGQEAA